MSVRRPILMLHHDEELDALEVERVERQLSWDAEGRRYLSDLETIGSAVREATDQRLVDRDLTDQIMARVQGAAARSNARPHRQAKAWQRRTLPFGLVSTALAAAAMFWLSVRVPTERAINSDTPQAVVVVPGVSEPAAETESGVLIESVDFGGGGGSIFMVQGGRATTPVVWLTEPSETEGRSEPL